MLYRPAPEVADIADRLIGEVPEHEPLDGLRIEYVFIDKAPKSGGRVILGRARKITGLAAWLAQRGRPQAEFADPVPFGVIEISEDRWKMMSASQRVALVDHELCHFHVEHNDNGELELSTHGHDVEEFAGIIRRHGLWKEDLVDMGAAVAEQLRFDLVDGAEALLRDVTGNVDVDTGEIVPARTTVDADLVSSGAVMATSSASTATIDPTELDPLIEPATRFVINAQTASVRALYQQLKIGPARANLIMDQLETLGVVSAKDDAGRRTVTGTAS